MKIAASLLAALLPLVAAGAAAQGANIPMKPPGSASAAEIGRASCRERVFGYV